ncbi:MAG: O-antigen ligase family protein [Rhodospirillales bacterium]
MARQPRIAELVDRYAHLWIGALLFVYFLFGFIGSNPLSGGALPSTTGGTNVTRQLLLIGVSVCSLPVIFHYRKRALALLQQNVLILVIYGWLGVTALWSAYPPLTLRRLVADLLVLALLVAAVTTARSWRLLVYPIALAAAAVVLADVAATVLVPRLAFGPLGAMGIHTNKNLAGVITLVALLLIGGSFFSMRTLRIKALVVPIFLLGVVFLVLTKSKTSLGLLVLVGTGFPALYLVVNRWSAAPAIVPVALVSVLAGTVAAVAGLGIPASSVAEFVFGDATLTRRTELWAYLQSNIASHPLLGSGWGAFWDTGAEINPINAPPQSWVLPAAEINTAHSGYIDIWLQAGAVGLALVVLMLVRFFWVAVPLIRRRQWGAENQRLIATVICVVFTLALYNFVESILFRPSDTLNSLVILAVLATEQWSRLPKLVPARSPAGRVVGGLSLSTPPGDGGGAGRVPMLPPVQPTARNARIRAITGRSGRR